MSRLNNKCLAITLGDPAGIGPEITFKALNLVDSSFWDCYQVCLIGSQHLYDSTSIADLSEKVYWCEQNEIEHPDESFTPGQSNKSCGVASLSYLAHSVTGLKSGQFSALVTAPVCKESIAQTMPGFQGHTEFLAQSFGIQHVDMMFVCDEVRSVIVTRHIPLADVPSAITPDQLTNSIMMTATSLQKDFGITHPTIAVCGINPHAGENGLIGEEEANWITACVEDLQKQNSHEFILKGPVPADTIFAPGNREHVDVIIAMYHDQGLTPVKALAFDRLTNLTIGLPFIRTSPAHGTAFNIAGQNIAKPHSMQHAIELAAHLALVRNPL